jgi:hypothetical protein
MNHYECESISYESIMNVKYYECESISYESL